MNSIVGSGLGERLRFLARDTAVYGIASALNKILALVTFPLLARHFSVDAYGTLDLLNTWAVLLTTLLLFGTDSAAARFYYQETEPAEQRQVITQAFVWQLLVMAIVLPAGWVMAEPIAVTFGLPPEPGTEWVRLIFAQAPFFVLITYTQGLLKWTFRRTAFLLVSVGSTIATVAGLLIVLALDRLTLTGVFEVYLWTRALFGVIGLWLVRDLFALPAGLGKLRMLLPFAIPFAAICMLNAFLPALERLLVGGILGAAALGYFAAGAKVAMLINLPISALEMSWGPFSLVLRDEEDAHRSFNVALKVVCALLFGAVLLLTGIADLIVRILGSERYEGAGTVAFALCMGMALQGVSSLTTVGIVFSLKSYLKIYSHIVLVAVALVAIPLLATLYGIAGAAWGSMLAMLAKTVFETWLSQRAQRIHWDFRGVTVLGLVTLGVGVLTQLSYGTAMIAGISYVPLAALPVFAAVAWMVVLSPAERAMGIAAATSAWKRLRGNAAAI
ncbi:MAG: lipopolysaccharide biosynthesis protein [Cypionkella sp.]